MFDQTKVSDAAWLWMEFLSQPDNLADWTYKTEGTLLPPTKSLLESDDLAKEKPVLKPFADLMACGVASSVSNPKYPRIETILNERAGQGHLRRPDRRGGAGQHRRAGPRDPGPLTGRQDDRTHESDAGAPRSPGGLRAGHRRVEECR